MAQNYDIKQFSSEELKEDGKIIIPTYQRGIVWKHSKRKDFINTIFKGNPFGVVLLYEKDDKYEVVDGLQRLSTMKAYMDTPLDFYGVNDSIDGEELLDAITEKKLKSNGKKVTEKALLSERKKLKKKLIGYVKQQGKPKAVDVWKYLAEEIGFDLNDMECFSKFSDFYEKFLELLKFPNILIPAIVYTGPYDELPDVFQRLNTGSVKLTKYEIFASMWNEDHYVITDDEIIEKVIDKYVKLAEASTFDVNFSEYDIKNNGITFFEYCYAVSEILNDETKDYSVLFPGEKKSTDPTGFELLALICGLSVNKASSLIEKKYLGKKNPQFLIQLKNSIVDCVSFLYESLKDWIIDIKNSPIPNESTYQMYHMILSIYKNTYDIDLENKTITRKNEDDITEWRSSFKRFANKHYLVDNLTKYWSKNRQVSDLDNLINNSDVLNKYTNRVSRESLSDAFNEYCADLREKALTRAIDNSSKLFLNYLYKLMIKEDRNRESYFQQKETPDGKNGVYFDIEHITPVAKFDDNKMKLPISALGNLCYLPVKDNRSKREKTIYQYADERPSLVFDDQFKSTIDYPSREDFEFLDYAPEEFNKSYLKLVDKREASIKDKLVNLMMDERFD